jgi:DNA-binding CsgD family transcriptional regulator
MKINTFQAINLATSLSLISFFFIDITIDLIEQEGNSMHFYLEVLFVFAMIFLFIFQIREFKVLRGEIASTNEKLLILKKGTTELINSQINLLKFTAAETDIAWLLIKGTSYKDIAKFRNVSERTVNQQVTGIFKKSNARNRHEFITSFIEDLME